VRCSSCGRDIDAIGQDNCSSVPGQPLCEDCAGVSGNNEYMRGYEEEDSEWM
jgi:hypothetical protein